MSGWDITLYWWCSNDSSFLRWCRISITTGEKEFQNTLKPSLRTIWLIFRTYHHKNRRQSRDEKGEGGKLMEKCTNHTVSAGWQSDEIVQQVLVKAGEHFPSTIAGSPLQKENSYDSGSCYRGQIRWDFLTMCRICTSSLRNGRAKNFLPCRCKKINYWREESKRRPQQTRVRALGKNL